MTRQRGFSLLEILVAFSILALSLGILMQIFSGSLRNADAARDRAQAVVVAQSLLASAGVQAPLEAGGTSGTANGRFRWQLLATPVDVERQAAGAPATVSTMPAQMQLWAVTAIVGWGEEGHAGSLTLVTLRAQPAMRK